MGMSLSATEGCARPEGGREAPALWVRGKRRACGAAKVPRTAGAARFAGEPGEGGIA